MLFHAKNGSVCIDDTDMDYVSFGKGNNVLIMLPRLADGLTTVKGMALTLALTYRAYAKATLCLFLAEKMIFQKIIQRGIWQKIRLKR